MVAGGFGCKHSPEATIVSRWPACCLPCRGAPRRDHRARPGRGIHQVWNAQERVDSTSATRLRFVPSFGLSSAGRLLGWRRPLHSPSPLSPLASRLFVLPAFTARPASTFSPAFHCQSHTCSSLLPPVCSPSSALHSMPFSLLFSPSSRSSPPPLAVRPSTGLSTVLTKWFLHL